MSTFSLSATAGGGKGRRGSKTPGGAALGREAGRDARLSAAAVLEVLAGARTPAEAATALGLSLPRYYQVEAQALRGLVAACEPRPRGRQPSPAKEVAALHQENQRLRRDVARQQALVRAARRAVGLGAPPAVPAKAAGKKPRRRRARALDVAAHLRAAGPEAPKSPPSGAPAGAEAD
jgi:hypothetical protein